MGDPEAQRGEGLDGRSKSMIIMIPTMGFRYRPPWGTPFLSGLEANRRDSGRIVGPIYIYIYNGASPANLVAGRATQSPFPTKDVIYSGPCESP